MTKKNKPAGKGGLSAVKKRHVEHRKMAREKRHEQQAVVKPITKTGTLGKKPERRPGQW